MGISYVKFDAVFQNNNHFKQNNFVLHTKIYFPSVRELPTMSLFLEKPRK